MGAFVMTPKNHNPRWVLFP